ncbi:MAG: patatin-like phospholipase family protein [Vulcanimicrobiaceae bacterium]
MENNVKRFCDIVMKGGITSGIVYPAAVYEISKAFRFKSVGGTSAGAIAAVITAAAERRRALNGDESGFTELNTIPDELAENNLMMRLFRPNARTKSVFQTLMLLLGRTDKLRKSLAIFSAYPVAAILGALPGIILFLLSDRRVVDVILAALVAIFGAALAACAALVAGVLGGLNNNFYGLVTGVPDDDPQAIALSTWLEEKLEQIGGITMPDTPLTFAMLWDVHAPTVASGLTARPDAWDINLEMVSTNVTYGRPLKFPFSTSPLFFRASELRAFLPEHVVKWMEDHGREPRDDVEARRFSDYKGAGLLPLPPIGDVPIILATRMSLAFPMLLSAVPLYAADFSLAVNQNRERTPDLERVWFSDGGLSSNFPITMFDAPLPRWPTFAINLGQFTIDYPEDDNEEKNVYIPRTNAAGRLPQFSRFNDLLGFLSALLDATRNWNDSAQMVLPGYRDRIVTVKLAEDEGGLNLDMPPKLLLRLKARGAAAGRRLVERFGNPDGSGPADAPEMGWSNHRWLRFRTTMGAMRTYLSEYADVAKSPEPPDPTFAQLIPEHTGKGSYPVPAGAANDVEAALASSTQLGEQLEAAVALEEELPKPAPDLEVRPALRNAQ